MTEKYVAILTSLITKVKEQHLQIETLNSRLEQQEVILTKIIRILGDRK